jgi:hypothetical protein
LGLQCLLLGDLFWDAPIGQFLLNFFIDIAFDLTRTLQRT